MVVDEELLPGQRQQQEVLDLKATGPMMCTERTPHFFIVLVLLCLCYLYLLFVLVNSKDFFLFNLSPVVCAKVREDNESWRWIRQMLPIKSQDEGVLRMDECLTHSNNANSILSITRS